MKKALSILLAVLLMFSVSSLAFAEDAAADDTSSLITVYFYNEGTEILKLEVESGKIFSQDVLNGAGTPAKAADDTYEYIFDGWAECDASGVAAEGAKGEFYSGNFPALNIEDGTERYFAATYVAEEISTNTTFWKFIESIFERINLIFEYFAKVFEGIIDFDA